MKNINNNLENDTEDQELPVQDKNLQCIRVEINSHVTVFLYYKKYPKADSKKFPQDRSAIIFYFDNEKVDQKFLWQYLSLIGQVEELEVGSYINKKGNKKKRRVVNFAIVKFLEEETLESFLNRYETQIKINNFLEIKKNRNINLDYDPMKDEEEQEEEEEDEDGFVTVRSDKTKKRFSKKGLSFKVMKKKEGQNEDRKEEYEDSDQEDGDIDEEGQRAKKKKEVKGDFYWNYHILDKKKQSKIFNSNYFSLFFNFSNLVYDELKNLFAEDKKALEHKSSRVDKSENNKAFKKPKN